MDKRKKKHSANYSRVMPRVFNSSRSSLTSSSVVIRHEIPSSVRGGAKPSVTNVSSSVFSELPTVLGDYVPDITDVKEKRTVVVKPKKTIKSLDPAKSPVRLDLKTIRHTTNSRLKCQDSAPVVGCEVNRCSGSVLKQCYFSSRSQTMLHDLKREIKDYEKTESLLKLRSKLHKKCGVLLDDMGQVAEDKGVQAGDEDREQIETRIALDHNLDQRSR